MSDLPPRTLLLDSNGFLQQFYHGIPDSYLAQVNGETLEVRALFGYMRYIHRLHQEFEFDHLVHVMDHPTSSTTRLAVYPEYKANREPSPPDLARQKELLVPLLRALGHICVEHPDVEADDALATLSHQAKERNHLVLILSRDKDILQLVEEDKVAVARYVADPARRVNHHEFYHRIQDVQVKMGVRPDQVADYLALVGDTADNIPGLNGCGPKKACTLLEEYGDLDTLLTYAHEVKGKLGERLRDQRATLLLYRHVTTTARKVRNLVLDEVLEAKNAPDPDLLKGFTFPHEWQSTFPGLRFTPCAPAPSTPAPIEQRHDVTEPAPSSSGDSTSPQAASSRPKRFSVRASGR